MDSNNQLWQKIKIGCNLAFLIISLPDFNAWDEMMNSGAVIFFSVFMSAFTLTCLVLAVYKFAVFAKIKGCQRGQFTVTQTMLVLEMVGNTSK